jgi:hypothetical protein
MLREYLNRKPDTQSTLNRVMLLWAATKLPGLIQPELQKSIIDEVSSEQQSDGGWQLSALAWPQDWSLHSLVRRHFRVDGSAQRTQSDAYATALVIYVLEQAGISKVDPRLKRGLSWLAGNQSKEDGSWRSYSLTKRRDPSSMVGRFMSDAATSFAVLALSGEDGHQAAVRDVDPGVASKFPETEAPR